MPPAALYLDSVAARRAPKSHNVGLGHRSSSFDALHPNLLDPPCPGIALRSSNPPRRFLQEPLVATPARTAGPDVRALVRKSSFLLDSARRRGGRRRPRRDGPGPGDVRGRAGDLRGGRRGGGCRRGFFSTTFWFIWTCAGIGFVRRGLSHGVPSNADSCSRNSSGVSLRNSQKLRSGNFTPSRPYGVCSLR